MHTTSLEASLLQTLCRLWATPPTADPLVEAHARELLLDTIGCAISSLADPAVAALFRHAEAADPGPVRFPGSPHGVTVAGFCLAFGAAACWQEACEGLAAAHGRPGLHAIPAPLANALARHTSLGRLLDAIVAGYEIGGRLGIVCRIRPGMHVDGTWGSFAAAAAMCHLAGTNEATALAALEHAACHMPFSLYFPIASGSTARNAYVGHGAAHGAASALATLAGLGGPPGSITEMLRLALGHPLAPGESGPSAEPPAEIPPPGHHLLHDGYLKPYPAVRHVHYGAAAAEAWRGDPAAITAIHLHVYPEAITYCANRAPTTAIQAQFSLSYGLARALATGRLDPTAYAAASLADPQTRRLEALVQLHGDLPTGRRGCILEVRTGPETWRLNLDRVPGDPGLRMTRPQIRAKFLAYAAPVIGAAHAQAIAHRLLEAPLSDPLRLDP